MIALFHPLDGIDVEIADLFGQDYAQLRFVHDALPESDEKATVTRRCLLGLVAKGGIEVRAQPWVTAVIENESSALPSRGSTDEIPADDDD